MFNQVLKEGNISLTERLNKSDYFDTEKKRKYISEIDSHFSCPVVGTCLSFRDQKRILKKAKISYKKFTPYEIHQLMVRGIQSKNQLSRRINNYLNQKYRCEVNTFKDIDEQDFLTVWGKKMETGDVCGLFWVAVTRPDFSEETLHDVFGDVHMLAHLNGGEIRKELHEANILREKNRKMSEKLKDMKELRRKTKKELDASKKTYYEMERKLKIIKEEKKRMKRELKNIRSEKCIDELKANNHELQLQLKQVQCELQDSLKTLKFLKKENAKFKLNSSSNGEIISQLKREVKRTYHQATKNDVCDQNCPIFNLCSRRILIVGGMSKLKEFYRDLIEKMGGIFECHDGNTQRGENVLHNLVGRVDIVLCPIDCNSHGACLSVKKFCKRQNKPYRMLPNSSLSSISRELLTCGDAR